MLSLTILINVDVMMVGKLGGQAVAATGLGGWIYLTVVLPLSAIEVGMQVLVARRFGEKRITECGKLITLGVGISVLIGSLFLLLLYPLALYLVHSETPEVRNLAIDYFRIRVLALPFSMSAFALRGFFYGIGNSVVPMITEVIVNVLNIFFNYIFIFGKLGMPALGVSGAALASALSTVIGFGILSVALWQQNSRQGFHIPRVVMKELGGILRQLLNITYPVFIQNFLINIGFYIFLVINDYISVSATAATNIVLSILCISGLPAYGFGIAAATLIGQKLGEGKPAEARKYGWFSLGPGVVLMGVAGLIFMFFGRELMRFYIADETVIEMGAKALRLIGAVEFIDAFGMVLSRALQGAGQTKFVMVAEVCVHWFIFLPLAYILGVRLQLGIIGTWLALVTYAVCFALLMLRKFISPEWEMQRV